MRLSCRDRMPFEAEHFWAILHAPAYEALVADALGLAEYREIERRDEPAAVYRRLAARPRALPASVQTLLQRAAGVTSATYEEEQWRRKDRMEVRWRAIPSILRGRIRIEGVLCVEPVDEKTCLRIVRGEVRIRVPLVGGLLERAVVSAIVESYGRSARLARPEDFPAS
jgi:hypothetical protein